METVVKLLLEVVEHLTYSHTFRSEAAGNEARRLLGEARAALIEPAPVDAPEQEPVVSTPVDQAPAPPPVPAVPTGPEAYGNA